MLDMGGSAIAIHVSSLCHTVVYVGDLASFSKTFYFFVLFSWLQKYLHLLEAVFESMPQLVLQSIFLIRTFGTELEDDQATYFIFTSIAASL